MVRSKRLSTTLLGLALSAILLAQSGITVQAGSGNYLTSLNGGVAVLFDPGQHGIENVSRRSVAAVALDMEFPKEEASTLVMANVNSALNVRSAPSSTTVCARGKSLTRNPANPPAPAGNATIRHTTSAWSTPPFPLSRNQKKLKNRNHDPKIYTRSP